MINNITLKIISPKEYLILATRKEKDKIYLQEILLPKTINIFSGIFEYGGLFCNKIFGDIKNKFSQRYRIGIIFLNTPIFNPLFKNNYLPLIFGLSQNFFDFLIYYSFIFDKKIKYTSNILLSNFSDFSINFLNNLNIIKLINKIKIISNSNKSKKRLKIFYSFIKNNQKLSWLLFKVFPIICPGIRPIINVGDSLYISSINNLYRKIISINNKLKQNIFINKINKISIIEILLKRKLQQNIDYLFSNKKNSKNISLVSNLDGKEGIFRQNILGKRIDFSGRTVISSSGNYIPFGYIGIPLILILNLFKEIIFWYTYNKKIIFLSKILLFRIIKKLISLYKIVVNRAPTLHKYNIQAYKIILTEDLSIKFPPIYCKSYNADFDGDQLNFFMILSKKGQKDLNFKLCPEKIFFSEIHSKEIFPITNSIKLGSIYFYIYKNIFNISLTKKYSFNHEKIFENDLSIINIKNKNKKFYTQNINDYFT